MNLSKFLVPNVNMEKDKIYLMYPVERTEYKDRDGNIVKTEEKIKYKSMGVIKLQKEK